MGKATNLRSIFLVVSIFFAAFHAAKAGKFEIVT